MRKLLLAGLVLAAALGVALWFRSDRSHAHSRAKARPAVSLSESLAPLRDSFNESAGRPRLLAVLSPSCPVCLSGAQAIESDLLPAAPELAVLMVWTEVLPWDPQSKIGRRVQRFLEEPAIHQFADRRQLAARAVGELMTRSAAPLWDVYLYYPAGTRWENELPPPAAWLHQQSALDPEHYRTGPALRAAFRELAARAEPYSRPAEGG